MRSADGTVEVHVVELPSAAALAAYRADPRRADHQALLEASRAEIELLEVTDV